MPYRNPRAQRCFPVAALTLALVLGSAAQGTTLQSSAGPLDITEVAGGLDEPWGLAFLPDGRFLITERGGVLTLFSAKGGEGLRLSGLPDVRVQGQGGLLDVLVPADFETSREVWLTYSVRAGGGSATAVGKGRLSADEASLEGFETLYTGDPARGGRHFGSRLVEGRDGTIFATFGDRGTGPDGRQAQDPALAIGKVVHLNRDGLPATTLPGTRPGVHSLGHRNPQGAAMDGSGTLWVVEHGAKGGDEVNAVRQGANYGWPVISFGENYDGSPIGTGTAAEGLEQPAHYWDPSIAPSGMMFHSGAGIAEWRGDLFIGSLKFDHITRLDPDNGWAEEILQSPETARVRDVREGPDGAIWFLSVGNGALYRMAPEG